MHGMQILCVLGHKITVVTSKKMLHSATSPDREFANEMQTYVGLGGSIYSVKLEHGSV